jgi:endonuclease/exonuclease/phosphatase family metal-dependent hydrolase
MSSARGRRRSSSRLPLPLLVIAGLLAIGLALLQEQRRPPPPAGVLRIGTWNLQWFGQGDQRPACPRPRTSEEIDRVARYIDALDVHLLALQEIGGRRSLRRLLRRVEQHTGARWRYRLSPGGYSMRLALIWNADRLRVEDLRALPVPTTLSWLEVPDLPEPFEELRLFHRPPLVGEVTDRLTGMDFLVVVVHLKARISKPDAPPAELVQREEVRLLREWLEQRRSDPGLEQDVILLGDFNFDPEDPLFAELTSGAGLISTLPPTPRPTWKDSWTIDHILLTPSTRAEWGGRPLVVHDERFQAAPAEYLCAYSDHMPVTLDLAGQPDD